MRDNRFSAAVRFSFITAALMTAQSLSALLRPSIYRDADWARMQWPGNDAVTLLIAVPTLIASALGAHRGSASARLVMLGGLSYALYSDTFYLFGAAFNSHFLLYCATYASSSMGLITGFASLDLASLGFPRGRAAKWVAGYMIAWSFLLGGLWVGQSLTFVFSGQLPEVVRVSGHPTSVVFAADLAMMVPAVAWGGWLLWRRVAWGYALGVVLNVKGVIYTLALIGMSVSTALMGGTVSMELSSLWMVFCAASLASVVALMRGNAAAEPATKRT